MTQKLPVSYFKANRRNILDIDDLPVLKTRNLAEIDKLPTLITHRKINVIIRFTYSRIFNVSELSLVLASVINQHFYFSMFYFSSVPAHHGKY